MRCATRSSWPRLRVLLRGKYRARSLNWRFGISEAEGIAVHVWSIAVQDVPGEHSTGGKQTLTDTSRRGNRYLRKLFVQGAHAVLQQRMKQSNGLNTWLAQLTSRKRIQVAAVALANKMARMVWAVLSKGEAYRPPLLIETTAV
jgi:hypothetical protein